MSICSSSNVFTALLLITNLELFVGYETKSLEIRCCGFVFYIVFIFFVFFCFIRPFLTYLPGEVIQRLLLGNF